MDQKDRPIIDYATAPKTGDVDVLSSMRSWRLAGVLTLGVSLALAAFYPVVAELGLLFAGAAAVMTLIYMTRAASRAFGRAYALSHLFLALLLMPVFLLGWLIIPSLVQSDIDRQRGSVGQDG